jgi:two-component system response regulator PilR (NtrC family)
LSGEETHSILIVDDEKSMREFLEIMLTQEGYQVTLAENGERAGSILDKQNFDLVITDIRMKDIDGIGVLKKAKSVSPKYDGCFNLGFCHSRDSGGGHEGGGL